MTSIFVGRSWRSLLRALASGLCILTIAQVATAQGRVHAEALDEPSRIPMIEATDTARLREHFGQRVIVVGTIRSAQWSRTGKVMNIEFAGGADGAGGAAGGRGLLAVVFDRQREAFNDAWGGDFAKTVAGRRVRLYGEVAEYGGYDEQNKGRPQMILNSPEQVTLPEQPGISATSRPAAPAAR